MTPNLKRRAFLKTLALSTASLTLPSLSRAAGAEVRKKTYTYKTAGACAIKADVYPAASDQPRPVLIWIHGGALIVGGRDGIDTMLRDLVLKAGYAMVSIDYRLAPETKLPAILEDVHDACRWVREKGPELFHVDPDRIAIAGGSAGGYLTLTCGYRIEPRPAALVAFWGYGDVAGDWLSKPDPFYRRQPLVPKDEAYQAVAGPVVSGTIGKTERGRFYLYCRQQGIWPKEVTGHDPDKEPRAFDPFCPIRNVSAEYPPTLLIHGTKDTDVPYEQSATMAKEFARKGVAHKLITVPGGAHGLGGSPPAVITQTHEEVMAFLDKRLHSR